MISPIITCCTPPARTCCAVLARWSNPQKAINAHWRWSLMMPNAGFSSVGWAKFNPQARNLHPSKVIEQDGRPPFQPRSNDRKTILERRCRFERARIPAVPFQTYDVRTEARLKASPDTNHPVLLQTVSLYKGRSSRGGCF